MPVDLVTPAYVLRTRPYGESDRIVTLLTQDHGKITGIAKGAKNSRIRFGGTLEPFVHIRAVFRQRTGTDLAFLVRCELIEPLRGYSRDIDLFAAGSYVLDLTDRMVFGRESGTEVYRLLHEALGLLDGGAPREPLLRAFELHLLGLSGYGPGLDRCRTCGAAGDEAVNVYLVVDRGGLVCRRCVPPGEVVRPIGGRTALALARLAAGPLDAATTGIGGTVLAEARAIAEQLLAAVTSGPVRSRAFLALADRPR